MTCQMIKTIDSSNISGVVDWLRRKIIPLATLAVIIVISLLIFFYRPDEETIRELHRYRYLGAFLISLLGNASVLLPGIVLPLLTGLGLMLYPSTGIAGPIIVGLVGAAGAAMGEIMGYMAGYSGRAIIGKQQMGQRLVNWVGRRGLVATIFVLSMVPLFFDLVGIAAGVLRFPLWKFILLCWAGRTVLYSAVVVGVAVGWRW